MDNNNINTYPKPQHRTQDIYHTVFPLQDAKPFTYNNGAPKIGTLYDELTNELAEPLRAFVGAGRIPECHICGYKASWFDANTTQNQNSNSIEEHTFTCVIRDRNLLTQSPQSQPSTTSSQTTPTTKATTNQIVKADIAFCKATFMFCIPCSEKAYKRMETSDHLVLGCNWDEMAHYLRSELMTVDIHERIQ